MILHGAGDYSPPSAGEPNHWIEHLASGDLSVGTYAIPHGGVDGQGAHSEDEIHVVRAGSATGSRDLPRPPR